jgi:hypothetical protein
LGKVKKSIQNGTYAKLTFGQNHSDTDLKNIYVRPVLLENDVLVFLSAKYKMEEIESFHTIDEALFSTVYEQSVLTALYSRRKRHHLQTQQKKSRKHHRTATYV